MKPIREKGHKNERLSENFKHLILITIYINKTLKQQRKNATLL